MDCVRKRFHERRFVLGAGGAALRARRAFQYGWPFNVGGERQESEAVGAKAQVAWKSRRNVRQANRRSRRDRDFYG